MGMGRKYGPLLFLLFCLILCIGGCGKTQPVAITTAAAYAGRLDMTYEISGILTSNHSVNLAAKSAGRVRSVPFDVGNQVKAGELLIQLDTSELSAQLQQAQAAVQGVRDQSEQAIIAIATARSNLDEAQKTYNRVQALFQSGAAAQSQLDDAQNKLDQAQGALNNAQELYKTSTGSGRDQADAAVRLIQVEIGNGSIYSPIDGRITARNVNPGEIAAAGTVLMTVQDTSTVKFQGEVVQSLIPLLAAGQKVQTRVDAFPGLIFEGQVTRVGPAATATGQYFPVEISLNNPGRLMPGMTAKASLSVNASPGILVPLSAIRQDGGKNYVFVIKDGKASRRQVILGGQNACLAQIMTGIGEGDAVAASNINILQDGMKVAVRSDH